MSRDSSEALLSHQRAQVRTKLTLSSQGHSPVCLMPRVPWLPGAQPPPSRHQTACLVSITEEHPGHAVPNLSFQLRLLTLYS